ncbi:MAG: DUF4199 domain-containing protein [Chitinophagaceae bacterium]|nr:MAG: DUF4199 domain-containing protein [Chitinophagaceae bacterium]
MNNLTPLVKGLITGVLMVAFSLVLVYLPENSPAAYITYALYAGGIIWTLIAFSKTPAFTGKFSELFAQGFRCFIAVTIVMVTYIGIYSFVHPELADKESIGIREGMTKEKALPPEIEKSVADAKKSFVTRSVYSAAFGTFIIGAIFTLAGSTLVLMRRK